MKYAAVTIIFTLFFAAAMGQTNSQIITTGGQLLWSQSQVHEHEYDQTIRRSTKLASGEKASLVETLSAQIRPIKGDLNISSEREVQKVVMDTRIELIDLNQDGITEVIAQATGINEGCGATGNCRLWVFQKTPNGFEKLLDTWGKDGLGGIQVYTVTPNRTNGFNDLVLGIHDSAMEKTFYVYRYRSGQYRKSECFEANWFASINGDLVTLKNPQISQCKQ
jgi:hypothetical protein